MKGQWNLGFAVLFCLLSVFGLQLISVILLIQIIAQFTKMNLKSLFED